jgi:hypothetical protein
MSRFDRIRYRRHDGAMFLSGDRRHRVPSEQF